MTKSIDNPLGMIKLPDTESTYINLWKKCKNSEAELEFVSSLEKMLNVQINKEFIDSVALHTAIYLDSYGNQPNYKVTYQQGFVVYALFRKYLEATNYDYYNVVEVGTAKGFTALCLAKALDDCNKKGTIHTIDVLPNDKKIYWRCIGDMTGKKNRPELMENWSVLRDNFIKFHHGSSLNILSSLNLKRVHFAFLDGSHDYQHVSYELNFLKNLQKNNDMIVCDDFTENKYEGIVQAVLEFAKMNDNSENFCIFGLKEGPSYGNRGYAVFKR